MTESPPPLDYQPPPQGKPPASVGKFVIGLVTGAVLTVALVVGGFAIANASHDESAGIVIVSIVVSPVAVLLLGIVLTNTRHRSLGQGILTGVPLVILGGFVLCGLALRNI